MNRVTESVKEFNESTNDISYSVDAGEETLMLTLCFFRLSLFFIY